MENIIKLPVSISVCNKFREMQFYIHQAYVSPYRFWILICEALSDVCKVTVKASPMKCLLSILPPPLQEHKDIIHPLLMLARKAIMNKWVGDSPPLYRGWLFMIKDLIFLKN